MVWYSTRGSAARTMRPVTLACRSSVATSGTSGPSQRPIRLQNIAFYVRRPLCGEGAVQGEEDGVNRQGAVQ